MLSVHDLHLCIRRNYCVGPVSIIFRHSSISLLHEEMYSNCRILTQLRRYDGRATQLDNYFPII